MFIDRIDAQMLTLLQNKGNVKLAELSAVAGISASACQRRVRRLESIGVIRGYKALINPEAAGFPLQIFTLVTLTREETNTIERFQEAIQTEPSVTYAAAVTGSCDFLLWIVARDMPFYRKLMQRLTEAFPTLRSTTSLVMLEEIKAGTVIPFEGHDHPDGGTEA